MKRDSYINYLLELIDEGELSITDDPTQSIYYTKETGLISGDFDCGCRGVDHNILKSSLISWVEILEYGVVIVPETNSYISDTIIEIFEFEGLKAMALNNNHIIKHKQ